MARSMASSYRMWGSTAFDSNSLASAAVSSTCRRGWRSRDRRYGIKPGGAPATRPDHPCRYRRSLPKRRRHSAPAVRPFSRNRSPAPSRDSHRMGAGRRSCGVRHGKQLQQRCVSTGSRCRRALGDSRPGRLFRKSLRASPCQTRLKHSSLGLQRGETR